MVTAWGEMTLGGWLWMGLWIGGLVTMIWLIVRSPRSRSSVEDAQEILRARFALGEISERDYEQARAVLDSDEHGAYGSPKAGSALRWLRRER